MEVALKRIKKSAFDDVLKKYIDTFNKEGKLEIEDGLLETSSEEIKVNGKSIIVDLDVEKYEKIVAQDTFKYNIVSEIGMLLHKELKGIDGTIIPSYYMFEKEFWTYLTLKIFHNVVIKLRLSEGITENKIKQFIFNIGTTSRTGLKYLWVMVDRLGSEDDERMTKVAFEFIDPVKAILERDMSKESIVLKAFVQAIINNDCNKIFKQTGHRTKMPNYISCYAGINMLDAYDYNQLVEIITREQKNYLASI